jgi:hypothetical protein
LHIPKWYLPNCPTDELPPRIRTPLSLAVGPFVGTSMPVFWKSPNSAARAPAGIVDAWSSVMLSGILEIMSVCTMVFSWNVVSSS